MHIRENFTRNFRGGFKHELGSNFCSNFKLKEGQSFREVPRSLLQEIVKIGGVCVKLSMEAWG